jgi:hypothetical protein
MIDLSQMNRDKPQKDNTLDITTKKVKIIVKNNKAEWKLRNQYKHLELDIWLDIEIMKRH